jgi:hypothetical protein
MNEEKIPLDGPTSQLMTHIIIAKDLLKKEDLKFGTDVETKK